MQTVALLLAAVLPQQASPPDPDQVLAKMVEKVASMHCIRGKFQYVRANDSKTYNGEFFFAKPNKYAVTGVPLEIRCDGRTAYEYEPTSKTYNKVDRPSLKIAPYVIGCESLFGLPFDPTVKGLTEATIGKREAYVLLCEYDGQSIKLFVDKKDSVPLGWSADANGGTSLKVSEYEIDTVIADKVFTWTPPPTAATSAERSLSDQLLKVGTQIPAIHSTGRIDKPKPAKTRATLLVFWYADCEACATALPEIQKRFAALMPKGLNVIGLNSVDSQATAASRAGQLKLGFSHVLVKESDLSAFKVSAFPTWYLVDSAGKVVERSVGLNRERLDAALKLAGMPYTPPAAKSGS